MNSYLLIIGLLELTREVCAEICNGGTHSCVSPYVCCGTTCCLPDTYEKRYRSFRWSVWDMWYFWLIMIAVLMSCFGGCGYWRRRQMLLAQHRNMMSGNSLTSNAPYNSGLSSYPGRRSESHTRGASFMLPISLFSSYDSSTHQVAPSSGVTNSGSAQAQGYFPSPPSYNEVISKPTVYPPNAEQKDELPPYPGNPENTDTMVTEIPPTNESGDLPAYNTVIGLPPYAEQQTANQDTVNSVNNTNPDNQHRDNNVLTAHQANQNRDNNVLTAHQANQNRDNNTVTTVD